MAELRADHPIHGGVEIERALHRLRKDGKVRQSGSYPYGGWELVP
jgi:hypothetical protein